MYIKKLVLATYRSLQIPSSLFDRRFLAKDIPNKYHVDLIVVGQTGMNVVERWMMGSVSEHIIRHAPCDVLIVRNKKQDEEVNND